MRHGPSSLTVTVFSLCVLVATSVGCGSEAAGKRYDGGTPGAGGATASGGVSGTGGLAGNGGALGSGGAPLDSGVTCAADGAVEVPAAARRCSRAADCTIVIAARCCAEDRALGVATSEAAAYAACLALPPDACQGLGCAKEMGLLTDTGRSTSGVGAATGGPIDLVVVGCSNQLCTTDVISRIDGGRDAPALDAGLDAALDAPAADAGVDLAPQPCGDAACRSGQACALVAGGPQPPCVAPTDAGTCPEGPFYGLVLVDSCSQTGGSHHQPGCTTPPPSPRCYDLPDGCGDYCSCVCRSSGGNCSPGPGYYYCGFP